MKVTNQKRSLIVATVAFSLAALSNVAWPQQYIAEELLDEYEKQHSAENSEKKKPAEENDANRSSEKTAYEIDPRLTPEYWGIEEDTIF
jgi:hypothetical protein